MAFRTNKTPVLQEKSASGSVASFNTALAMPLASCNIAVNAWQEGSGDPSPSNVRPIHGFSEVNATRAGKNLFDEQYPDLGTTKYRWIYVGKGTFTMSSNQPIDTSNLVFFFGGKVSEGASSANNVKGNIYRTVTSDDGYVTVAYRRINDYSPVNYHYQIEAGSTATDYEPYVTPTIYPIQFGQEVYGVEVDVVNGVAHVTHGHIADIGSLINYKANENGGYFTREIDTPPSKYGETVNLICSKLKTIPTTSSDQAPDLSVCVGNNNSRIMTKNVALSGYTLQQAKEFYSGTELVYPLAEPFDIQLTPTQIETLIGNNTIFADTGDVDLTFNDLDIAKRGSFREVFKLP